MEDMPKGSTPHPEGCRFLVWAPHAEAVSVVGGFNEWNPEANPMDRWDNGLWFADVQNAKPGDEYRYRIINGGTEILRIDPCARNVSNSAGNAIITEPISNEATAGYNPPALNEMVIYEMHIGTFGKHSDNDDPGNLRGSIERLEHLRELGVNSLEVMPITEFAGGNSWGYNPAHIFAVDSGYGNPDSFVDFVNAAHGLGIAVILDVVYNHMGTEDLNIWQFDGWSENEKGGIYFYNDWRAETPWGETRPDFERGQVREFIRDNVMMWLHEYGVDGLRWDGTAYIRNAHGKDNDPESELPEGWSLMQWINGEMRAGRPSAFSIAEDLRGNPFLTKPIGEGGAGFNAQCDAGFAQAVRAALIEADDSARNLEDVRDAIIGRYNENAFERVIYTESHDEVANGKARVPEEVDPGKASSWAARKKSALGAVMVFASPGIPMIFQGQEFLEDDWFHEKDPLDWSKKERFSGVFRLYQNLIRLRLNRDGHSAGLCGQRARVYHLNSEAKILCFHRWSEEGQKDSVIVVANFSAREQSDYVIGFPSEGKWVARFNSDSNLYDSEFGNIGAEAVTAQAPGVDDMPASGAISVAPYSALILSRENG